MSPYLTPDITVRAGARVLRLAERVPATGDPRVRYERMSPWDRPGGETGGVCPEGQRRGTWRSGNPAMTCAKISNSLFKLLEVGGE